MTDSRLRALVEADPAAARRMLASLSEKVVVPHSPAQRDVIEATERFLILDAGRRWGKTRAGGAKILREARKHGKMLWWVAPTYKVVKRGYREVLRQLPEGVLAKPAPRDSSFDAGRAISLHFKNGTRMEFYSAERPEGMLGEGVNFAVLDEAATMPATTWTQIIRPTLADNRGRALLISTPRGRNWFYDLYVRGQDPLQPDYRSWMLPSMTNPTIPPEEWEEMEATLPRAVYEQEILAQFVSDAAAVFRFKEEAVVPLQRPAGHVVMGVDLAKHHDFTVFDATRAHDRQPCYHDRFNAVSWPTQRQRLHDAVARIIEDGAESLTVVLDSTGIGDVVYDDLAFEGLDVVPVKFTPQWKQQAVMLLGADLERERAFLHEAQVQEFQSYTYSITAAGRWQFAAPDSGHDDEVSAKLLAHWGICNLGVPDITVLGAMDDRDYVDGEAEELEPDEELEAIGPPTSARELLLRADVWD